MSDLWVLVLMLALIPLSLFVNGLRLYVLSRRNGRRRLAQFDAVCKDLGL